MLPNGSVDAVLIIGAIAGERGDGPFHLVQQRADLRGIVDVVRRRRSGEDLASAGVHADMQLAPGAAGLGAVPLAEAIPPAAPPPSPAVGPPMPPVGATAGAG